MECKGEEEGDEGCGEEDEVHLSLGDFAWSCGLVLEMLWIVLVFFNRIRVGW